MGVYPHVCAHVETHVDTNVFAYVYTLVCTQIYARAHMPVCMREGAASERGRKRAHACTKEGVASRPNCSGCAQNVATRGG